MRKRLPIILDTLISLAIFAGAWAVRAISSTAFVTWDEPAWVYRSVKFLLALSRGDWAGTLLTGHPGVVTMWSGALGLTWHRFVTQTVTVAQLAAIDALPTLQVHDPETIRQLVALLPAAKSGLLILHALIAVALFWLLARLLDRRYALVGLLLLALDPYYLALSRVLHIDAVTSGLMLISIVGLLIYAMRRSEKLPMPCSPAPQSHEKATPAPPHGLEVGAAGVCPYNDRVGAGLRACPGSWPYLVGSGVAGGLAMLTKSYALFVVPAVGLFLLWAHLWGARREDEGARAHPLSMRLLYALRDSALWGLAAVAIFCLAWPAMWSAPRETLGAIVELSFKYATAPGDATSSFFMGQVTSEVGARFYPLVIFFRSTPLVLVGGLLAMIALPFRGTRTGDSERPRRHVTVAMLVYALLYVAIVSLSAKKFDRYTLPALLALDLLAALGLVGALELIGRAAGLRGERRANVGHWVSATIAGLLVLVQAVLLLRPLYPAHYVAYYNPWAGGPRKAVRTIPVGWGEGIERATAYLASKPDAQELTVATWAVAGVAADFPGQLVVLTPETVPLADYVLLYIGDIQAQTPLSEHFYGVQKPEFVVELNGIEYAWLYANSYYEALAQEIARTAEPDDVILLNAGSAFQRHYDGGLATRVIDGDAEAEVAGQLASATQGADKLYYIEYTNEQPRNEFIRRQLGQNALYLWQKPFAYGTLSCYQLAERAHFRQVLAPLRAKVDFGHQLLLEGYGLSSDSVEYRQELGLGLRWRAMNEMDTPYHLFLHLVDERGRKWGQRDLRLRDGDLLSTNDWPEDTAHLCNVSLPLDAGIPPGRYWVALGLYDLGDLSRLEIMDGKEREYGNEFRVGPIVVTSATVPPAIEELPIQHPTDLRLAGVAQVLGYTLSGERPLSGEELTVTLFWRCLAEMDTPYDLGLRLARAGDTVSFIRAQPVGAYHPTDEWLPGEVLRYSHALTVPPEATSGTYELTLNFYGRESDEPLVREDLLLTRLEIEHRERLYTVPDIQHPVKVVVGDSIELLGYDLGETTVKEGEALHLTLYWRALRRPERSYVVFTHLLDSSEAIHGQRDSVPMASQRPTDGWVAGEVIVDPYEMPVDADAPPGPHRVEVGMYDPASGQRLPVARADGEPIPERRVLLDEIVQVAE